MGLFDKLFKNKKEVPPSKDAFETTDGIALLEKHESGLLDDQSFLSSFGKAKIFYSTPFGDHKDGGTRLFVLPAQDKTAYLPVFSSAEGATEFYDQAGRCGFLIMESSFHSFLKTTSSINAGDTPIKLGTVIDPESYGVTIGANALDAVIEMTQ